MTGEAGKTGAEVDLWDFALSLYEYPRISALCLMLQDRSSVDVNMLILNVWMGVRGVTLSKSDLALAVQRCEPWRVRVVLPLRDQRRAWKGLESYATEYAAAKDLELAAERVHLEMLAAFFRRRLSGKTAESRGGMAADRVAENLCTLADYYTLADDQRPLLVEDFCHQVLAWLSQQATAD